MVAFATRADLEKTLQRSFSGNEIAWIDELLEQASSYLRSVAGQWIYPKRTSTYTAYPSNGREDLPQRAVRSVDSVKRDGEEIAYEYRPGYIKIGSDDPIDITFTYGFDESPEELKRLTCVLVAQVLIPLENDLGLTAGGLSSVQLDDFKLAFADGGASTGITLTPHAEAMVKQEFGHGGIYSVELR